VRPLPAGIPILPGKVKAAGAERRLPVGLIILLVIAGLAALEWFSISSSDDDKNRINPVVTRAMVAHAVKGTRLPVTLKGGPRILQIGNANVTYQGQTPTTCVQIKVLNAKTGAEDPKVNYPNLTCIEGLKYPIH
jgi:hypothetical protein